jgi:hypothetical protein
MTSSTNEANLNEMIKSKKGRIVRTELSYGKDTLLSMLAVLEDQGVIDSSNLEPKLRSALEEVMSSLSQLENL